MTALRWSVVIPAYNEARRLPAYLGDVVEHFAGRAEPYEIIVVDDGSTDGTRALVEQVGGSRAPIRVVAMGHNQGKGAAVRRGMLQAAGTYRLFTDADGATPIGEIDRLEPALAAGADVVIGSRALRDRTVSVVARPHRVVAGRLFNGLVERLGLEGVRDSQCGFKAFTARAADHLFGRLATTGFGFDVEVLLRARAAGYRIVEVAVNWHDQAGSKVGVIEHGPRMLAEVVKARWRVRRGR